MLGYTHSIKKFKLTLVLEYAFVTGSVNPDNSITELLDINTEKLTTRSSYPYASSVRDYVSFYYQSSFIVFGSYNPGKYKPTIASYNPASDLWTKLGELNVARAYHTGIRSLNSFYIYGGLTNTNTYPNEKCTLMNDSIECVLQDTPLDG